MEVRFNNVYVNIPGKRLKIVVDFIKDGQNLETHDFDFLVKSYSENTITKIQDYSQLPASPSLDNLVITQNEYQDTDDNGNIIKTYQANTIYRYNGENWEEVEEDIYLKENLIKRIKKRFNDIVNELELTDEQIDISDIETKTQMQFLSLYGF